MKILIHHPRLSDRRKHVARKAVDKWTALCNLHLCQGDETWGGTWELKDGQLADVTCLVCLRANERASNLPLPCTVPDCRVILWTRQDDGRALVHSCVSLRANKSRCGVENPENAPKQWIARDGDAASITCRDCLHAEGLLEGRPLRKSKPRPKSNAGKQDLLDLWFATQGKYHHSDPRAVRVKVEERRLRGKPVGKPGALR